MATSDGHELGVQVAKRMSIAEARDHLTQVVHEVEAGVEVELTRRGRPVAVLVPVYARGGKRGRPLTFMESVDAWRASHEVDKYGLTEADLDGLRDRSPGREVAL
jgi:prevent-host-death family protein